MWHVEHMGMGMCIPPIRYDMLLGLWRRRHGLSAPCSLYDARHDFAVDECLPYIFPLTTVQDLCRAEGSKAHRPEHTYVGEEAFTPGGRGREVDS